MGGLGRIEVDSRWSWLTCFTSAYIAMITLGEIYSNGIIQVALLNDFNKGEFVTSWTLALQSFFLLSSSFLARNLYDRLGWRGVAVLGSILDTLGKVLSAISPNIYVLFGTFSLSGIGGGLMYSTGIIVVQHSFEKRRTLATSLIFVGTGLGVLFFGWFDDLTITRFGWRGLISIQSIMSLGGSLSGITFRQVNMEGKQDQQKHCHMMSHQVKILALLCIAYGFSNFALISITAFTSLRAITLGVEHKNAGLVLSFYGVFSIVARCIAGWLAESSTQVRFNLCVVMLLMNGCLVCMVSLFRTFESMTVFMCVLGCGGCWIAIFPTILVDVMTRGHLQTSLPYTMTASSISHLIAPIISGVFIEKTGDIDLTFEINGCMFLVSGFTLLSVKYFLKTGNDGYQEVKSP